MTGNGTPPRLILLAPAGSYRAELFEQAAQRLGVEVVWGVDAPPPLIGHARVPLALDYRDVPASAGRIAAFASREPVAAVLPVDDGGTLIAAAAAERLRLPFNAPEAARAARDKGLMRQKFAEAGVPSPAFRRCSTADDLEALADETAYPCVVKPASLAGSRGVIRADDPLGLIQACARLFPILQAEGCSDFLVEDFIPGREVALEGLLDGGRLHVLALFDKPDPLDGPFFEETIYLTPSQLPEAVQQTIAATAAQAAAALGLRAGPVHAELRLSPAGPVMVELAARSIGGLCSKTLRFGEGISLEEVVIKQALGWLEERDLIPFRQGARGVMMIPIPQAGVLAAVEGLEAARQAPHIEEVEITAPLNQPLVPLPEGQAYLGFIFARGETPAAVEAALRAAHACLRFEILPLIAL